MRKSVDHGECDRRGACVDGFGEMMEPSMISGSLVLVTAAVCASPHEVNCAGAAYRSACLPARKAGAAGPGGAAPVAVCRQQILAQRVTMPWILARCAPWSWAWPALLLDVDDKQSRSDGPAFGSRDFRLHLAYSTTVSIQIWGRQTAGSGNQIVASIRALRPLVHRRRMATSTRQRR
jgi:hypothetical protein